MKVKSESEVAQSCPTISDPMDCSLPGSSVHRIFQARVLEWGAIAFSARHVQRHAKGIKSTHREHIRDIWNLWARFPEIQIKMRFRMRKKIVDAANHPNKVT